MYMVWDYGAGLRIDEIERLNVLDKGMASMNFVGKQTVKVALRHICGIYTDKAEANNVKRVLS